MKKEIIDRIAYLEKLNGYLTPEMVVNDAINPDSPLHGEFNWDRDAAANAHWIQQARKLIASVKVIITVDTRTVRTVAYVRDPTKAGNEQGYLSVEKVRTDKEMARGVLIEEFKRAGSALNRARKLAAAFNIEDEVDTIADKITELSKDITEYAIN